MTAITLPKRPDLTEIVPLSSSPDGQLNSFCMRCDKQEQTMSYAACLWRQGVLAKPDIRTPSDWAPCGEAARHGACVALMMRQEEVAAEQSIFFRKRNSENHPLVETKRAWVNTWDKVKTAASSMVAAVTRPAAPSPARPADVLTSMKEVSYADAITAMASEHQEAATAPVAAPAPTPAPAGPAPVALPGESPLAMARRIAAARAAALAESSN